MHDAQYVADDYPMKRGWGHSVWTETADLGRAAKVQRLALYHHDPARTDDDLDAIAEQMRGHLAGSEVESSIAAEGTIVEL